MDDFLDGFCTASRHQRVFYLWRPFLRDPDDDHVLELAVAAGADLIVTYNVRDFVGVRVLDPDAFLRIPKVS